MKNDLMALLASVCITAATGSGCSESGTTGSPATAGGTAATGATAATAGETGGSAGATAAAAAPLTEKFSENEACDRGIKLTYAMLCEEPASKYCLDYLDLLGAIDLPADANLCKPDDLKARFDRELAAFTGADRAAFKTETLKVMVKTLLPTAKPRAGTAPYHGKVIPGKETAPAEEIVKSLVAKYSYETY